MKYFIIVTLLMLSACHTITGAGEDIVGII